MDALRLLVEQHGFFTRAEARDLGYDDRAVGRAMRAKVWHRIRRGFYTFRDTWEQLDDVGRHVVRSLAVARSLGPAVALSHVSGLLAHGVDTWGVNLSRVHVTRLDGGAGRIEGDVVHHEGVCLGDDVVEKDGVRLLVPERCAVEAGSRASNEAALVIFDALLHRGLCDPDRLMERFQLMQHWPFVRHLQVVIRMADGRAESVGETRGRWLCWTFRLPAPVLQYVVRDGDGNVVGICDWAWPEHRELGEFDGRLKYGRALKPGQDAGEVVFAEKRREDLLREITGMGMVRLIWSDYDRPRLTAGRIRAQLRLAG